MRKSGARYSASDAMNGLDWRATASARKRRASSGGTCTSSRPPRDVSTDGLEGDAHGFTDHSLCI